LAENSKYEILLAELNSFESDLVILKNLYKEMQEKNSNLQMQVEELKKDNEVLQIKLQGLEQEKPLEEPNFNFSDNINIQERESLKLKLKEMVKKIDSHLSA